MLLSIISKCVFTLENINSRSIYVKYIVLPCRRKSSYLYKYDAEIESAINIQIQAEQEAAQNYLNMAVAFLHPRHSRLGAGGFFMKMYKEELGHMEDFIQYQLLRGGTPIINSVTAPAPYSNPSLIDAFTKAVNMEKSITQLLQTLVNICEKLNDCHCGDYVTSVFLEEQMHSVNEITHHITQLARLCNNEHSLYHYDLQLSKDYPYKHKFSGK